MKGGGGGEERIVRVALNDVVFHLRVSVKFVLICSDYSSDNLSQTASFVNESELNQTEFFFLILNIHSHRFSFDPLVASSFMLIDSSLFLLAIFHLCKNRL